MTTGMKRLKASSASDVLSSSQLSPWPSRQSLRTSLREGFVFRPFPKWLTLMVHTVLMTITAMVILITFFGTFPALETRYWPVVEKLEIQQVQGVPIEGKSIVYGTFNKVRQCEPLGLQWFRRDSNGVLQRVRAELNKLPGDSSTPVRPLGRQSTGPWVIDIPPEELRTASVVELAHRCHPFWVSITQFYP